MSAVHFMNTNEVRSSNNLKRKALIGVVLGFQVGYVAKDIHRRISVSANFVSRCNECGQ